MKKNRLTLALGQQKQKILQKLGNADKTEDTQFETLRQNWETTVKAVSSIEKSLRKQKKTDGLVAHFSQLGLDVGAIFNFSSNTSSKGAQFGETVKGIEDALREFNEKQQETLQYIQEYQKTLLALKSQIAERDNLQLDYDRCRRNVQSAKDSAKRSVAEEQFAAAKDVFESANESCSEALDTLMQEKSQKFQRSYRALMSSYSALFTRVAAAFETLKTQPLSMTSQTNFMDNALGKNLPSPEEAAESPVPSHSTSDVLTRTTDVEIAPKAETLSKPETSPQSESKQTNSQQTSKEEKKPEQSKEKTLERFRALFDYTAAEANELSFREGEILVLVERFADSEWWQGRLGEREGLFPRNFVEPLVVDSSTPSSSVRALFDFSPSEDNELAFNEGDLITVLEKDPESDWWKGELNGRQGLFPVNYTEPEN